MTPAELRAARPTACTLVMMYPVLAKAHYDETRRVGGDKRLMGVPLVLNWVMDSDLTFALAGLFLPDLSEYRTGLIIVGLPDASPWC